MVIAINTFIAELLVILALNERGGCKMWYLYVVGSDAIKTVLNDIVNIV